MTQQKLIEFMKRIIHDVKRKVFLIVDSLKVHHGKIVKAWLKKHKEHIELFFVPPYAPEYNPGGYLNNALKHDVHSGINPRSKEDINSKVQFLCGDYSKTLPFPRESKAYQSGFIIKIQNDA